MNEYLKRNLLILDNELKKYINNVIEINNNNIGTNGYYNFKLKIPKNTNKVKEYNYYIDNYYP